jgi:hypothetical protein
VEFGQGQILYGVGHTRTFHKFCRVCRLTRTPGTSANCSTSPTKEPITTTSFSRSKWQWPSSSSTWGSEILRSCNMQVGYKIETLIHNFWMCACRLNVRCMIRSNQYLASISTEVFEVPSDGLIWKSSSSCSETFHSSVSSCFQWWFTC